MSFKQGFGVWSFWSLVSPYLWVWIISAFVLQEVSVDPWFLWCFYEFCKGKRELGMSLHEMCIIGFMNPLCLMCVLWACLLEFKVIWSSLRLVEVFMHVLEGLNACVEVWTGDGGTGRRPCARNWVLAKLRFGPRKSKLGRRTCLTFVSGGDIRPPKVLPKVPCPAFLCLFCMHVLWCFRGFLERCS